MVVIHLILDNLIRIAILAALGAVFGWLRTHIRGQTLAVVRQIASDAVRLATQVGIAKGLSGPARYGVAADAAASLASRIGIRLPAADWRTIIEAAYSDAKPLLEQDPSSGAQAAANAHAAATAKS